MYPLWINVLGFQLGWWACILGVGSPLEVPSMVLALGLVAWHVARISHPLPELTLAGVSLVLGVLTDSVLQACGVIDFYGWHLGPLSPFWLWALWLLFAMTLNASLAFLQRWPLWVSALLGVLFGPLTYHAGVALGAAAMADRTVATLWIGAAWLLALPLLVFFARSFSHTTRGDT